MPFKSIADELESILEDAAFDGFVSADAVNELYFDVRRQERQFRSHGARRGARTQTPSSRRAPPKQKRKPSAYQVAYGKAFKKVAPRFKKKDGSWRKGGFAAAGRAARREPSVRRLKKK